MKIRKTHILARHFYNMEDDSAGIFYTEEGGGVDWLWDVFQDTRFVRQQQSGISEVRRTNLQRTTEKSPTRDAHGISSGAD
jgi:hypothetical protein